MAEIETLRKFNFERLLNEDTRTKSIALLGNISDSPAILLAEKTAFDTSATLLSAFSQPSHFNVISLMDKNDIYHWFLASTSTGTLPQHADAKITLIYPASEQHVRKYSQQRLRMVTETPEIYRDKVQPYVQSKAGKLQWVYNILDHTVESERIILEDSDRETGFILLPDLKWDRKTMSSLYTMAVVHRKDISSLRDLKKKHVPWLKDMHTKLLKGICDRYEDIENDQLKVYVHYQPSYYHFHIHVVAVSHDGGHGQTAGKAWLLNNVISQLEGMSGGEEAGFADVELSYVLGEEHELWQNVFAKGA